MFKKAISCFCATVLMVGAVVTPLKFLPIFAETNKPASGDNLLYSFDDVNSLSEQGWEARNANGGKALTLSLETDSANVYGGTGKSLKIEYDTAQKESSGPPTVVLRNEVVIPRGEGITFWLKSEKETTITVLSADANWNIIRIDGVKIKEGENLLFFKYTDFTSSATPNLSKLNQLQIRAEKANDKNTFYFDNIGFFDNSVNDDSVNDDSEVQHRPASGENVIYSFDDVNSLSEQGWEARNANGGKALTLSLETDSSNVYGGTGKSLKIEYDTAQKESAGPPTVVLRNEVVISRGEGITFWLKSEKDTTITVLSADANWNIIRIDGVKINKGENLLFFKYTDFTCSTTPNLSKLNQLQIRADKANDKNTLYFDNIGFFDSSWEEEVVIPNKPASGEYLLYSFDDINSLSEQDWQARWDNGGTALNISLEKDAYNVYNGVGKSLKMEYDTSKKESSGPPTIVLRDKVITPQGDGITFWLKSEKDTTITVLSADADWNIIRINGVKIKKGENLLFFKYTDFTSNVTPNLSKLNQFQIRADKANDKNTFYFDNFGFFDEAKIELPPNTAKEIFTFDSQKNVHELKADWEVIDNTKDISLDIESNVDYIYGEYGNSLKVVYNSDNTGIRYKKNINKEFDGILFWLKSEEETEIYLEAKDKNDEVIKTKPIKIQKGENLVKVKYSDFYLENGINDSDVIKQLSIMHTDSKGEYYLDCLGYYIAPVTHDVDFFEFAVNPSYFKKNSSSVASFEWQNNAEHYHTGSTDVKDNKAALKITYSNLGTANTNSVYYDAGIKISDQEPYIYGEDSEVAFWIYSEQEIKLEICYLDKNNANETISSGKKMFTIPKGESIVRFSMSELVLEGTEPIFKQLYQLQFRLYKSDGTSKPTSGSVWIDSIGFYDKNPDVNTDAMLHSDQSLIWWDFDEDKNVDETGWVPRWQGAEGKGVELYIEENPENVYGKTGKSLKVVCNTPEADNNQSVIWLGDKRIPIYGKGLTFWVKSESQTKFRIVGIDSDSQVVETNHIPIKAGENIVTVLWEDFHVYGDETAKCNIASLAQLQIRTAIKDRNTYWIDSIGYCDVENDNSNNYYSLFPPEEYTEWYEGVSVVGTGFEEYPGDDDMQFCSEWYFDSAGWIELEKDNENTVFRMDYDFTTTYNSVLTCVRKFDGVDPNGGISFWAKSSIERRYSLKVLLGDNTLATVVFKAGPKGRYYKIPFSAFWLSNQININYESGTKSTLRVGKITIVSDETCNPPADSKEEKFSLWLDDLKFVDSDSYKRPGKVNYYENGVRLEADEDAFSVGVYPSVDILDINESQKKTYLSGMRDAKKIGNVYQIDAFDINKISSVPLKAVSLTFDVPNGIDPETVCVYQLFIDGSLSKRNSEVTSDGRVKLQVYRLGTYVMGYGDKKLSVDDNDLVSDENDFVSDENDFVSDENDFVSDENDFSDIVDDSDFTDDFTDDSNLDDIIIEDSESNDEIINDDSQTTDNNVENDSTGDLEKDAQSEDTNYTLIIIICVASAILLGIILFVLIRLKVFKKGGNRK